MHGIGTDEKRGGAALLLIDWINDLEFEGGEALLLHALKAAETVAVLKKRARSAGLPVIYVNDHFGQWRANFRETLDHCLRDGVRGRPLAERLYPDDDDFFVLKPKHSGFFGTTLPVLLDHLGVGTLILTGLSGDICVLLTAADAYMRGYRLFVPADAVASNDPAENRHALGYMERVLDVDTRPSQALDLAALHLEAAAV